MKKKVDFIGIGVKKSGTTWLFNCLNQIDQFDLPSQKELHYFSKSPRYQSPSHYSFSLLQKFVTKSKKFKRMLKKIHYWKGKKFYLGTFHSKFKFAKNDVEYLSNFNNLNGFTGEITPAYSLLDEKDIKHMHELLPGVKLIYILRNPIDRAWSDYKFTCKKKLNKSSTLNPQEILRFMKSDGQTLRSNYLKTIDLYSKVFTNNQILICFYDAIINQPESLIKNILNHICGKNKISIKHINFSEKVNSGLKIDMPEEIHNYLKIVYHDQIKELSEKYGGYFNYWYEETYNENEVSKKNDYKSSFTI